MAVLEGVWRPLTYVLPAGSRGAKVSRSVVRAAMAVASPRVRGTAIERIEEPVGGALVRGEWVRAPGTTRTDAVVLYIHGSGYAICSSRTHRGLTSRISAATGLPVFSIDYRLAPSARFPAAQDDVRAAWNWLVAHGHDPARIVVAGDSAGGHLAITLTLELARGGDTLPVALVALSPVIDLSLASGLVRDRIEHDPFASARVAQRTVARYATEIDQRHDRLRVTFDDLDTFPPTLVHAGSREMLATDSTELVRRITGAGFPLEYRVWPGMMHVFQAMTALIPESRAALDEIAAFIGRNLPDASALADREAAVAIA
jgi:acetyl esterase/lipase